MDNGSADEVNGKRRCVPLVVLTRISGVRITYYAFDTTLTILRPITEAPPDLTCVAFGRMWLASATCDGDGRMSSRRSTAETLPGGHRKFNACISKGGQNFAASACNTAYARVYLHFHPVRRQIVKDSLRLTNVCIVGRRRCVRHVGNLVTRIIVSTASSSEGSIRGESLDPTLQVGYLSHSCGCLRKYPSRFYTPVPGRICCSPDGR